MIYLFYLLIYLYIIYPFFHYSKSSSFSFSPSLRYIAFSPNTDKLFSGRNNIFLPFYYSFYDIFLYLLCVCMYVLTLFFFLFRTSHPVSYSPCATNLSPRYFVKAQTMTQRFPITPSNGHKAGKIG